MLQTHIVDCGFGDILGAMTTPSDAPSPRPEVTPRREIELAHSHATTTLPLVGRRQVLLDGAGARGASDGPTGSLHERLVERLAQEPTPILWRSAEDAHAQRVPERIGPFEILGLLGEGGMGTVYLAEQSEPIRRRVAIKLIHPNLLGRQSVLRFEAERQALARMQHPNIAQVFDAGTTEDGHPYVIMEALEGEPITSYCDGHRLDLRRRLEIFRQVCAGVQHAHQKGVLHRDLKPSNVLVTEDEERRPRVKIIDFGVAKALDDPLVDATQLTGDRVVGTPAYLSPESIDKPEQGADVRSDVYALGVILYQLICGCRPFERTGEGHVEFLWRIVKEEAARPSLRLTHCAPEQQRRIARQRSTTPERLQRKLARELDWLALQAVAKQRDERYASVTDLDGDVGRYLRDEPLSAGPPGRLYRLGKLLRRHRLAAAGVLLLLLVLSAGIVARTVEARRANSEAAAARLAEQEAQRAVEEARQVTRFLTEMFRRADPYQRRNQEQPLTVREVLDLGVERMEKDLRQQPRVRAELLGNLAHVYLNLGEAERAERLASEAVELVESRLGGLQPDDEILLQTYAFSLWRLGRLDEAEAIFLRSLEFSRDNPAPTARSNALMHLGTFYAEQGQFEKAEEFYREGWDLHPHYLDEPLEHVRHISNFGGVLAASGLRREAEGILRQGLDYTREHLGDDHPMMANLSNNLGNVLTREDRLEDAVPFYERAIEIRQAEFGDDSAVLASPLNNLAGLLSRLGRFEEAETLFRRSLQIRKTHFGVDHPRVAWTYRNLAACLEDQGRLDEAEAMGRDVVRRLREQLGEDHSEVARSWHFLCELKLGREEGAEAEKMCLEAVRIEGAVPGGESAQLADMWRDLAAAQELLGKDDQERRSLATAEAIWSRHLPDDHADLLEVRERLEEVQGAQGAQGAGETMSSGAVQSEAL